MAEPVATSPHFDLEEIAQLEILRGVGLESVWSMLEQCPLRTLAPKEALLRTGEENSTLFMLLSGRVSVHLDGLSSEPVAFLEAGQTVGEMSVIDGSPASADVAADRETRVLAVDEGTFWRMLRASHELALNLLLLQSRRMRENNTSISTHRRERHRFEEQATIDGLTTLRNRRWFDDTIPRIFSRHERDGLPLSLMVIDIDHFKHFNDTYGHAAGDEVLREVALTLRNSLRPTDLPVRYGGEELVVLLPNTDRQRALIAADRVRNAIATATVLSEAGDPLPTVTVSIGVAELGKHPDPAAMFSAADRALYCAKHNGRNRVESEA